MDITELNIVNNVEHSTPSYTLNPMHRRIDLIFLEDNKIMVVGNADNNFVFWTSVTDIEDKEINEKIFNRIVSCEIGEVTPFYKVLLEKGYEYNLIQKKYHCFLSKVSETEWNTSFGSIYKIGENTNTGKYLVEDVYNYYQILKIKCKDRSAEGSYVSVLEKYREILNNNSNDYESVKSIIDIIRSENYLLLADEEKLKNKYLELMVLADRIYANYMKNQRY